MAQDWIIVSWEHNAFWRPNSMGYTKDPQQAGRYTKREADSICKNANYGRPEDDPHEVAVHAPEPAE